MFRLAVLIALPVAAVFFFNADSAPVFEKPTPIRIDSTPIDHFDQRDSSRRRFGALEFRGGLILSSPYRHFGGISGIRMHRDGVSFLAVSDRAAWLSAQIVYKGNRPVGIGNAVMAPVLNFGGKPARWDTESIAANNGILYVGIESKIAVVRFNFGKSALSARAEPVSVPPEVKNLPVNKGLEGMVFIPNGLPLAGALVGFSERGLDKSGNLKAFLIGGPHPGSFTVKRSGNYDLSDAALLPDGDILILERKVSLLERFSMRIRRIPLSVIRPGALVDGPVVIEADRHTAIDNMEALGVHRTGAGDLVLTLMSDDNFSPIQETLLLQFTFPGK